MEIEIKPTTLKVLQLFSERKYDEAIDTASNYLAQDSEDVELLIFVGFCLSRIDMSDLAYVWLKKALNSISIHHPLYKSDLWKKANECIANIAFSSKRDYIEAERHLLDTTENGYSTDSSINKLLGIIAHAKGQHKLSLVRFSVLGEQANLGQEEFFIMAISNLMLEDYNGARLFINKFLNLQSNFKPAELLSANTIDDNKASLFKGFITQKTILNHNNNIAQRLKSYNVELYDIYQQRDNIWHTTCLFNDLDGLLLYALIRHTRPKNVIEFSPYKGYSTVFIYKALFRNDTAFSFNTFDLTERMEFKELMSLFDIPIGIEAGDALKTVPDYIKKRGIEGNIDLCFVDSDHGYDFARSYIDNIFPLLGNDCIIAIHDIQYCPDSINIPFDFYSPINANEICETISSIGEAIALREFFGEMDDYVLISSHKLFGGGGQCAPPLPLNRGLIEAIGTNNPFLNEGNYWALPPMIIFAIPKHIWEKKTYFLINDTNRPPPTEKNL